MINIIKGLWNNWYPDEEINKLAEERLSKCLKPEGVYDHCRHYNPTAVLGVKCDGCGCYLKYKSKSPNSKCPLKKWSR